MRAPESCPGTRRVWSAQVLVSRVVWSSGALLDTLQRTGLKGYTAFLESLELDYPQLYTQITGKEPNRTFSILIGLSVCPTSLLVQTRRRQLTAVCCVSRHRRGVRPDAVLDDGAQPSAEGAAGREAAPPAGVLRG